MFYEVKVNLKPEQLELLRKAQVVELQPGIESLSDRSLQRMRKGTSSLQNVQFLLNTKQLGIAVFWNLLFGFPGEDASEYGAQIAILKAISHLPPPVSAARVRIDRFSPLYERGNSFGVRNIRPIEPYKHIYPELTPEDRLQLAYYFDADYTERHMFEEERAEIRSLVEHWKKPTPGATCLFYGFPRTAAFSWIPESERGHALSCWAHWIVIFYCGAAELWLEHRPNKPRSTLSRTATSRRRSSIGLTNAAFYRLGTMCSA